MLSRTQQVLALVADELNSQLLEACAERTCTEADLRELTGASHTTIASRLHLLEARGLLSRTEVRGPRGRPAAAWIALVGEELARLAQVADQFVLRVLQAQLEDHEADIRARTRKDVRPLHGNATSE